MEVKFNKNMLIPANFTFALNEEVLGISLNPDSQASIASWKVVNFKGDKMQIQLEFAEADLVSVY